MNCFEKHGRIDLSDKFKTLVDSGVPEMEAQKRIVFDEHQLLHKDLNDFKKGIGLKKSEYQAPEDVSGKVKEISDKYDKDISEQNKLKSEHEARIESERLAKEKKESDTKESNELQATYDRLTEDLSPEEINSDPELIRLKNKIDELNGTASTTKAEAGDNKEANVNTNETKGDTGQTPEKEKDGNEPPVVGEGKKPDTKEPETVGVSNAAVNERRLNAGLRPVVKEAKRKFKGTWEVAKNRVLSGQTDPRSYVADLHSNIKNFSKRAFNDVDNALVLMDRIDLTNQKNNALSDLDKSRKTNNDNVEALAWQQLSEIEQKLQQNDEVADKMGTVQGRALSSRRMLSYLDYSLASMKRDIAKYYPNKAIPKEVLDRLEKIEKEHSEALNKLQEYEQKWKDQQAKEAFDKAKIKKGKSSLSGEQKKTISDKLRNFADKFEKFGRADLPEGTQTQGIDFQKAVADAIRYIADKIESGEIPELMAAALKKFGTKENEKEMRDSISDGLKEAGIDESVIADKTAKEKLVGKISEQAKNSNAETITKDMVTPLRRLVNDYAKNGEEDFGKVLDDVHSELKDGFTNLTKEDIRDAYSGYGDVKLDSKKELESKVKEWKQEATLLGQLDDVLSGKEPHKIEAGEKKSKQSERIEKMRKDLEKKMKDAGIEWTNTPSTPEEKNARALTSLKTRLQTEITNLTNAIENKKDLPKGEKTGLDEEAKALVKQRNDLKDTLIHVLGKEGKKTLTDEERIGRAEKYLDGQITSLEKDIEDIKNKTYTPEAEAKTPKSITVDLMRGRRDALRDFKRKLLVDSSPKSSEPAIALEKYKDQIRNRLMEYSRRIEEGDFEEKENKKSFINDAEASKLELELKRAQVAFSQEKTTAFKKNRTKLQAIYDKINAWKRFSVLTGIPTIGKLGTAVLYRTVANPIEELSGTVLRVVPGIRTVSNLAPREGGNISFRAESSALQQWAKASTYKDAMEVIKKGQGELDYKFGKYVSMPPEALEVMGRIHGAMKNFAKRSEFARSYEKRMQFAIDHGADPSDELTQVTAMSQAYIDANRSIFMQDNFIVNAFNKAVQAGEESENKISNAAAAVTRFLLPIVKIPTNFVGESLNYSFGSLRVLEVVGRALTGHLNDMTPEAADGLMRSLKKGSIGAGAMAIGFFVPGVAGGYYIRGGKKVNEDDPDWGELQFSGVRIPRWATHFPLFEAMQLGATMRKIMDKDIENGKTEDAAVWDGVLKSSKGMIGEVPLFNAPQELTDALDQGEFGNKFFYPEVGSLIPIVSHFAAAELDTDENAAPVNYFGIPTRPAVKRTPDGLTEALEYRLPGLRQNVPTTEEFKEKRKEEREERKQEAQSN